jgi:hypothetical protein
MEEYQMRGRKYSKDHCGEPYNAVAFSTLKSDLLGSMPPKLGGITFMS